MTNKRLSSHSWISAYCKYLELEGIPYYVLRKGNLISGAILVKVTMSRDSAVLYHSILDVSGKSIWDKLCQGNHNEIDKYFLKLYINHKALHYGGLFLYAHPKAK